MRSKVIRWNGLRITIEDERCGPAISGSNSYVVADIVKSFLIKHNWQMSSLLSKRRYSGLVVARATLMHELYDAGASHQEIAKVMNCDPTNVYYHLSHNKPTPQ